MPWCRELEGVSVSELPGKEEKKAREKHILLIGERVAGHHVTQKVLFMKQAGTGEKLPFSPNLLPFPSSSLSFTPFLLSPPSFSPLLSPPLPLFSPSPLPPPPFSSHLLHLLSILSLPPHPPVAEENKSKPSSQQRTPKSTE